MRFGIITHAIHKLEDNRIYAYEPYVREMNLWGKYVDEIIVLAPVSNNKTNTIEKAYQHNNIKLVLIPNFNIKTLKNSITTLFVIPVICWRIFKVMKQVNHIHIRCPGNVGLLGCLIQILFPKKQKTIKYAGNWDPKSKQPFSYKLQKWIISNTFLTKKCKVLVYGEWKNQSKNIIPFFTASYRKDEIELIHKKDFSGTIKFVFVGSFSKGKQPMVSVKVIENLLLREFDIMLNMYGSGEEFKKVKAYIDKNNLNNNIILHGNQSKEVVKKAYKDSHFLLFISKSEGWPKVVAEAMFWRCLPISSNVSCINSMLGEGLRGSVLNSNTNINVIEEIIINYIENEKEYQNKVLEAQNWSQNYTLDVFEEEIKKLF